MTILLVSLYNRPGVSNLYGLVGRVLPVVSCVHHDNEVGLNPQIVSQDILCWWSLNDALLV